VLFLLHLLPSAVFRTLLLESSVAPGPASARFSGVLIPVSDESCSSAADASDRVWVHRGVRAAAVPAARWRAVVCTTCSVRCLRRITRLITRGGCKRCWELAAYSNYSERCLCCPGDCRGCSVPSGPVGLDVLRHASTSGGAILMFDEPVARSRLRLTHLGNAGGGRRWLEWPVCALRRIREWAEAPS